MTLEQIEEMIEDTRKLPRATDKVALAQALGTLEVARQLTILNSTLAQNEKPQATKKTAGK
ncbi:MAG: hypothetical protein ACRD3E_18520 [Terriglobales bacterium]